VYFFLNLHVYKILTRLQLLSSDYACFLLVAVFFEIILWYLSLIIFQGPKYYRLLSVVSRCWIYLRCKTGYSRSLSIPLTSEAYPTRIFSFSLKGRPSKQLRVVMFLNFSESLYIYLKKDDKILHQFRNIWSSLLKNPPGFLKLHSVVCDNFQIFMSLMNHRAVIFEVFFLI